MLSLLNKYLKQMFRMIKIIFQLQTTSYIHVIEDA